jgi:hypothetical protein
LNTIHPRLQFLELAFIREVTIMNDKQVIGSSNGSAQRFEAGRKHVLRLAKGERVSVHEVLPDGRVVDAENVIATREGADLRLKYGDGTELRFEKFYEDCADNQCSVAVAGDEAGGYVVDADGTLGPELADGSHLVYAHGDDASLMELAGDDAALRAEMAELGSGTVSYLPAAAETGFGFPALGALGGGLGLAAAAGGGGGSAASPVIPIISTVFKGSFVAGPVLDVNGLVATAYDENGVAIAGATVKLEKDGSFTFDVGTYKGRVLVVVHDTTPDSPDYWDEATGAPKNLGDQVLRAATYAEGGIVNVNVNVFTEVAVRQLGLDAGKLTIGAFTREQIDDANKKVGDALGLKDLVNGDAPIAVVTNSGAANIAANSYGKLLAAASGVDEAGSTEATIGKLLGALHDENPVLATSTVLLNGAKNVVDKVPGFLAEAQMSLSDYFFIADTINGLRSELAGALEVGDYRTIKELSDELNDLRLLVGDSPVGEQIDSAIASLADALEGRLDALVGELDEGDFGTIKALNDAVKALDAVVGANNTALSEKIGAPASGGDPATGLYATIDAAVSAAVDSLTTQIDALQSQIDANDGDIAQLISDAQGEPGQEGYVPPTTASIAGLKAALAALEEAGAAEIAALQEVIGAPASGGDPATGLYATIDAAVSAAVDSLTTQIDALQSQIDANDGDIAQLISDAQGEPGQEGYVPPTTASIAGLKAALDDLDDAGAAQITALQEAIGVPASGDEPATGLYKLIADLEASIDVTAPTISDIALSATGADGEGHLNAGDVVTAIVTFSEAVLVTGTPQLQLEIGQDGEGHRITVLADYHSGAGTDRLVFSYTIEAGQADADGISVPDNALQLGAASIRDAFGNAADLASVAREGNGQLIVDDGSLSLSLSAGTMFGSRFTADNVVVGLTQGDPDPGFVFLSELDADGRYQVPEGERFTGIDDFLMFPVENSPEFWDTHSTSGGNSVFIDFSGKLAWTLSEGFQVIISEAALRSSRKVEYGDSDSAIDAYIDEFTVPAEDLVQYDGFNAGETFAASFLAQIAGHDPANIALDITSPLTVAQAVKLVELGFDLQDNVTYSIRDYDTTTQAAMLNPATAAVMRGAEQVTAIGDELGNSMRFTSFDDSVNLRVEAGDGNDTIDAGRGNDEIVGGRGADTINLTYKDPSQDRVVYQTLYEGKTLPVATLTFSNDEDHYREGTTLSVQVNGTTYSYITGADDTMADALAAFADAIEASDAVGRVNVNGNVLEIVGEDADTKLSILTNRDPLGPDCDLDNSGQKTLWKVAFSDAAADYPDNASKLDTFTFDRKVSITIDGATIEASVAYDDEGAPDPEATIASLQQALLAEMGADGTLSQVLGSVTIESDGNGHAVLLVLEGKEPPADDGNAPTFTVDSATVETAGEQQQTQVAFSSNDADYYEGGRLSVTINNVTIFAEMVANSASQSVANLVAKLEASLEPNGPDYDSRLYDALEGAIQDTDAEAQPTSTLTFTARTEAAAPFDAPAARLSYAGEAQRATIDLENASSYGAYVDGSEAVRGAQVYFADGKVYVSIRGEPGDEPVTVSARMGSDAATTAQALVAAIQDEIGDGGALSGLIGSVESDGGRITLTAAEIGKQAFEVSDVRLDYAGVKQIATVTLDEASTYSKFSFTDDEGNAIGIREEGKPAVYFEGGRAHLTITPIGEEAQPVTVSADMVPDSGAQATLTGFFTNDLTLPYAISLTIDSLGGPLLLPTGPANVAEEINSIWSDFVHAERSGDDLVITTVSSGESASVQALAQGIDFTLVASGKGVSGASATAQALADAVEAELGDAGALHDIIGAVNCDGTTITLEAAVPGDHSFSVSDARLDYQGVHQIATAAFDTDASAYYEGGQLHLGITPASGGEPISVDADMVAGSVQGSIDALVAAIQKEIDGTPAVEGVEGTDALPAIVTIEGDFSVNDLVYATSDGYNYDINISVSVNGVNVASLSEASLRQELLYENLGDVLESLAYQSQGLFTASVDGEGNIVFQSRDAGADVTLAVGFYIGNYNGDGGNSINGMWLRVGQDGTDPVDGTPYLPGSLTGIVESVSVDDSGVITLAAKPQEKEVFDVTTAEIDYQGVKQVATASFDGNDAAYYSFDAYGEDGTASDISLTLNGHQFRQEMLEAGEDSTAAQRTVEALLGQIEGARTWSGEDGDQPLAFAEWLNETIDSITLGADGTSITFAAREPSNDDLIQLSESSITVAPVQQVTALDFGGIDFDTRLDDEGNPAQVELTIAGVTITANAGADRAATLEALKTAIEAEMAVDTDAGQPGDQHGALYGVVEKVELDESVLTLTAARPGTDPLQVSVQYESEAEDGGDGKPNVVTLTFDDGKFDDPSQIPSGSTVNVLIGGVVVSLGIGQQFDGVETRSEQIVAALKTELERAGGENFIGTVQQGYVYRGEFTEEEGELQDGDNVLRITASRNGAHLLGSDLEGTIEITVIKPDNSAVPFAATVSQTHAGYVVYDWTIADAIVDDAVEGRDEGLMTSGAGGEPVFTIGGQPQDFTDGLPTVSVTEDVAGESDDPKEQTVTNAGAGAGEDSSYYGDPALAGSVGDDGFNGQGVLQGYVNPDDGYVADSGSALQGSPDESSGDSSYHGDAASSGDDDSGGVRQSYSNPGDGYAAADDSPASGTATDGDDALYGSDNGYYDDDGLHTSYLNGGTSSGDADDDDRYLYTSRGEDTLDGFVDVDEALAGAAADTADVTVPDAPTKDGFAAFEWDSAWSQIVSNGNDAPDVIHNFQTDHDFISLQGALHDSTVVGDLNGLVGWSSGEDAAPFDLSNDEYGLVVSQVSTLCVDELGDAEKVADLLGSLFSFTGTQDNAERNTSIFAITAQDDPSVTAIWAHQQASACDDTVEAIELYQLAVVHTRGDEFGLHSFDPQPEMPV